MRPRRPEDENLPAALMTPPHPLERHTHHAAEALPSRGPPELDRAPAQAQPQQSHPGDRGLLPPAREVERGEPHPGHLTGDLHGRRHEGLRHQRDPGRDR